jgi:putative YphP/YqiW family bacilliredoxin
MPYPEELIKPFREELTRIGFTELRTPAQVETELSGAPGTALVVVNSVCGCAAGAARPGVTKALQHTRLPAKLTTVFAGQDLEATAKARSLFTGYRPSSPQIALMKDGAVVFMLERHQIEGRDAGQIAAQLTAAFDAHCA